MEPDRFLRAHPPFAALPHDLFERAVSRLEVVFASRGEAVLRRSDPENHHLFMVRKGAVRLERDGTTVQVLEEGETFGYPSLLAGGPPTVDVTAEEDTLLLRIPAPVFHRLMEDRGFADYFLVELAGRLRSAARVEGRWLTGDLATPVGSLVTRPAVFASPEVSVAEAARLMTRERVSSLLVLGRPMGIVTDRDLRRRVLARSRPLETPVSRIMSQPLRTAPAGSSVFEALAAMLDHRIHHLAITERDEVVGVVTDADLFRHHHKSPLSLLSRLDKLDHPASFPGYAEELAGMVETLFQGNLDAVEIGRIVASVNDAAIVRLLRLAEDEMGEPPRPYAWIVFGSEGRREQALLTDQDNALVYGDGGGGEGGDDEEAAAWFAELGRRVTRGLVQLGIPPCPGGFMADRWHLPLGEWQRTFRGWLEVPDPEALIEAANFFDFRPVHGALDLTSLHEIVAEAPRHRSFLAHMAKNALTFRPPLGLFRRIRREAEGIDLKRGGIIPVVSLARLFALEGACVERGTVERLRAAAEAGSLSQEGQENLSESFRYLLRLRLEHQLASKRAGRPLDNRLQIETLSHLERRHLKDAFLVVQEMQQAVAQRYGTSLLG